MDRRDRTIPSDGRSALFLDIIDFLELKQLNDFRITMLTSTFLNWRTREEVLQKKYVIQLEL